MKISVVICTYNRAELLLGALRTLDQQDFPNSDYEIVVVDDGSTDHTSEAVRTAALEVPVTYRRIAHAGRSAARNEGIAAARGDYILFVDDDILAPPDLVAEHYRGHVSHRATVIRGPIINVPEYHIPLDRPARWGDYSSAFFCTCNASVSKQGLLAAGGFDENFTEYGFEDNELGWRLKRRGWRARFRMSAIVYHYKPHRPRSHLADMIAQAQELGRSAAVYYSKHPHWQVGFATGLHPLLWVWNRVVANERLYALWVWLWQGTTSPSWRSFLERRIFSYHYVRAMESAA